MPRSNHVVMANDGAFKCINCGTKYEMAPGASLSLYTAAMKAFADEHKSCKRPNGMKCTFCRSPDHEWHEHVNATCKHPWDWLSSEDTGLSSKALYTFFTTGRVPHDPYAPDGDASAPKDPADFGRCFRLLHAPWAADWRARIVEMAKFPSWTKLVHNWDELERLYVEEFGDGKEAPKLYARMQELRGC